MLAARITLAHFSVSAAINLPKSTGEPASTMPPKVCKARLQFRIDEAGIDLFVELVDDVGGRVLGRTETLPPAGLITRYELADRRNVRQSLQARCGRYRQWPQF